MKLIAILGSPRGMAGNTGMLLSGFLQGASDAGADIDTFLLADLDVQPCRGCEACHMTGACPITDDFAVIHAAMAQADGFVLASPNYIHSVSAQMKALLDRCSGSIHLQAFTGKYAAALVTSGSADEDEVGRYLQRALRMTGCQTVGSVTALGWQMANPSLREPALADAAALGRSLVAAISTRQQFSAQDEERAMIREHMRQLVIMQKDHWPYEYTHWTSHPSV
ncbi:MAG TPA: flavodoxin family protein [Armatimonadota bacterium]|jgi:multimeric flavodoxin WrbA